MIFNDQKIKKTYKFKKCPYANLNKSDIANHIPTKHMPSHFISDVCGKLFMTDKTLKTHAAYASEC